MQGIILAAGKGKRLHPITTQRTKAMAPVAGKPMVERVMDLLIANGIREYILLISPDDPLIEAHFRSARPELAIRYVVQPERLGMGHALQLAAAYIHGPFIVSACDNLTTSDHVGKLVQTHVAQQAAATLSLMAIDIAHSASTGIIAWEAGRISRIVEKPQPEVAPSNIASLPLYVFAPRILEFLPRIQLSARGEYELQDAIQMLIDDGAHVTGVLTPSRSQLTNAADLLALNRHYLAENVSVVQCAAEQIGARTRLIQPVRIEPGAMVGADCCIGPHVYVEAQCAIGDGVQLENVVLLRGAQIPNGATHRDAVIL